MRKPDRFARREQQRALVAVVVLARQKFLGRRVGQVAGGEDVRQRRAGLARNAPALGQVRFDEGAVAPAQFAERMQRLDHARALGPAAAGAGGQGDHRHLAVPQGLQAELLRARAQALRRSVASTTSLVLHVLDDRAGGQPVLGQADAAVFEVGADLLVLDAVKAVLLEQARPGSGRRRLRLCRAAA